MMEMNVGEWGLVFRFEVGEDVSSNTNTLEFRKPSGGVVSKAATVGVTNHTSSRYGAFAANNYVEYTLIDGDIDVKGTWWVRAVSVSGTAKRKTDWDRFKVNS